MPEGKPLAPVAPILSIAPQGINTLDPNDTSSIHSLWTVVSKISKNLENGRRLENISWRLWNRELFYQDQEDDESETLEGSVPSLSSDGSGKSRQKSSDSLDSSRKRHKQLSSVQLQELFKILKPGKGATDWQQHPSCQKKGGPTLLPTQHIPPQPSSNTTSNDKHLPSNQAGATVPPTSASTATNVANATTGASSTASSAAKPRPSLFEKTTTPIASFNDEEEEDDDSSDFYSDDDDVEDDEESDLEYTKTNKDGQEDSSSDSKTSQAEQLGSHNRNNTSTSIVRGFQPGSASVSVNRTSPPKSKSNMTDALNEGGKGQAKETKPTTTSNTNVPAHSKAPRGKMFFIESSPSDNEEVVHNSISTDGGGGSIRKTADKPKASPPKKDTTKTAKKEQEDDSDSAWDSVDDESDTSSFEDSVFDEKRKEQQQPARPKVQRSLLSSLFLNDQDKLRREQQERQRIQQEYQHRFDQSIDDDDNDNDEARPSAADKTVDNDDGAPHAHSPNAYARPKFSSSKTNAPANPTENLVNVTAKIHAPPPTAMSPRTTRRNMIQNELSESLRRNLWMERQRQRPAGSSATRVNSGFQRESDSSNTSQSAGSRTPWAKPGLRRSHTSVDVSNWTPAPPSSAAKPSSSSSSSSPSKNAAGDEGTIGDHLARNKSSAQLNYEVGSWREDMDDQNMDFNYHARGW